jgi:OCT family organic cation transporter-like MFS transporter 4/5
MTEVFPTVIRGIAIGAASTCARVSSGLSPVLILYFEANSMNPLLPIVACLVIAGAISHGLPETLHKDMPDFISEEKILSNSPSSDA